MNRHLWPRTPGIAFVVAVPEQAHCPAKFLFFLGCRGRRGCSYPQDREAVVQLIRCKEELDVHESLFAILQRLHLDLERLLIKDASVHVLHLSWEYELWPWARVVGEDLVADVSDICPCPLHSKPAPPSSAKSKAKAQAKAGGKAKAKAKAKGAASPMAKRAQADDVAKRLRRELEMALGFAIGSDDEGEQDENVVPEAFKDEEDRALSNHGIASQWQCPLVQRLLCGRIAWHQTFLF